MKRLVLHLFLAAALSCVLASCHKDGKVIPRAKFSRLYADMLVADSWLQSASDDAKKNADTTAFYEPIFRSYGYSTEDYLASVEYYLNDPGRFGRILRKTSAILESDIKVLNIEAEKEKKVAEAMKERIENLEQFSRDVRLYPDLLRSLAVTDRMDMALDADGIFFPTRIVEDTLFSGPRIILSRDSLSVVTDTTAVSDTVSPAEQVRLVEGAALNVSGKPLIGRRVKTDAPLKDIGRPIPVK